MTICIICNAEHTDCLAPNVPASTCGNNSCIDSVTSRLLKNVLLEQEIKVCMNSLQYEPREDRLCENELCPICFKFVDCVGLPGDLQTCTNHMCTVELQKKYTRARYFHRLLAFAAGRDRMVCDFCNHTFLPSDNSFSPEFRYNTFEGQFIDDDKTPIVCYDCAHMHELQSIY